MSESKTNPVEAAKWEWEAGGAVAVAPKKPMDIRVKAVLQAIVMTSVGFLFYKWKGHIIGPAIIWSLAVVILIGGLFVPPIFHAFEKFGAKLGVWVGTGLTYALLVPFYYLVFAPAHLILKMRGLDPMARKFPTDLPTYWIPRKPVTVEQYKRQH